MSLNNTPNTPLNDAITSSFEKKKNSTHRKYLYKLNRPSINSGIPAYCSS